MNEGLTASIAQCDDLKNENESLTDAPDDDNTPYDLPLDFALVGGLGSDPCSLDKALRGPNAKEWQTTLDYEISQLEKLGTWVIEDLPEGCYNSPFYFYFHISHMFAASTQPRSYSRTFFVYLYSYIATVKQYISSYFLY